MHLNISKCIQFSRELSLKVNSYYMKNVLLNSVTIIKKLYLTPNDFKNVSALKTLYVCLVRSQLESNTCVWSPYYQWHRDRLERVQRKSCVILDLDLMFIYKILKSNIDCSDLMQLIQFMLLPNHLEF